MKSRYMQFFSVLKLLEQNNGFMVHVRCPRNDWRWILRVADGIICALPVMAYSSLLYGAKPLRKLKPVSGHRSSLRNFALLSSSFFCFLFSFLGYLLSFSIFFFFLIEPSHLKNRFKLAEARSSCTIARYLWPCPSKTIDTPLDTCFSSFLFIILIFLPCVRDVCIIVRKFG